MTESYAIRVKMLLEYIKSKNDIGIVSKAHGAQRDHRGWLTFITSKRSYEEVLCPELARICCTQGLIPKVTYCKYAQGLLTYVLSTKYHAVDSHMIGLRHYDSVLAYLRRATDAEWWEWRNWK